MEAKIERSFLFGVLTKIGQLAFGTIAGAVGAWLLSILYDAIAVDLPGDLLVPSAFVVLLGGVAALRKSTRLLGFGIILGSVSQAIFFAWLFSSFFDIG